MLQLRPLLVGWVDPEVEVSIEVLSPCQQVSHNWVGEGPERRDIDGGNGPHMDSLGHKWDIHFGSLGIS